MGLRNPSYQTQRGQSLLQNEYTINNAKDQEAAAAAGYQDTLHDVSPTGRVRPWRQHRLEAELLAEAYHRAADITPDPSASVAWDVRADKVEGCATAPSFRRCQTEDGTKYLTLSKANFCRDRLCPMCQWRRSLKMGAQARAVVAECNLRKQVKINNKKVPGYKWLMLTLTQRNVDGPDLPAEITRVLKAFKQLTHSDEWQAAIKGWLRVLEVTHNTDRKSPWFDSYHPHLHVLLCVNRSYFKSKAYLSHADWVRLWQHYIKQEDPPQVDIHLVKAREDTTKDKDFDKGDPKLEEEALGKAVAEVTKYASKPGCYLLPGDLDLTTSTVVTLATALHGRRLAAWGGLCKEVAQLLQLDNLEGGDLIHIDDEATAADLEAGAVAEYIEYNWALGVRNYVPGRSWQALTDWAAAAEAAKERRDLRPLKRRNEVERMQRQIKQVHKLQSAAGPRIANRAIHARDYHTMDLLEAIADAKTET